MINQQMTFIQIEALAICEMIAQLTADDYEVATWVEQEDKYAVYVIEIRDTDGKVISKGRSIFLIDALQDAYTNTPERKTHTAAQLGLFRGEQ